MTTPRILKVFFDGENRDYIELLSVFVQPQQFVDVVDTGRQHVAAIVNPDIKSERIFGCARPWNWNDALAVFRKTWPERKFMDDMELGKDLGRWPTERGREILEQTFGQADWASFEDSVKVNAEFYLG